MFIWYVFDFLDILAKVQVSASIPGIDVKPKCIAPKIGIVDHFIIYFWSELGKDVDTEAKY